MMRKEEIPSNSSRKMMWEFILYTFAFAWGAELLIIAMYRFKLLSGGLGQFLHYALIIIGPGLSPAYAAFIIWRKYEATTLKVFCKRIFYTGDMHITAIFALVFACIQFVACVTQESYRGNQWYLFILYMPLMILGGGLEEIGWRGVLQPQLEKRFSFLVAAVVEGILWSIWHLPLWLVPNTSQSTYDFVAFMLYCITLGSTLAAVYWLTKSIWACILIHAWGNTVLGGMYTYTSLTKFPGAKTIVIYIIQMALIVLVCNIYSKIYCVHHRE
jgi:uncharacterized protein